MIPRVPEGDFKGGPWPHEMGGAKSRCAHCSALSAHTHTSCVAGTTEGRGSVGMRSHTRILMATGECPSKSSRSSIGLPGPAMSVCVFARIGTADEFRQGQGSIPRHGWC